MSLKLGAKGIIIPFPKAYLGNKLVFQMQQTKRWYNGYVAIGRDNIYYSLDNGVTWTSSVTYGSSTTPTASGNVVYGNDAYVAFWRNSVNSNTVYTSTDRGETWSSKTFNGMENICFVNNQFFLLPRGRGLGLYGYVSMDGKNWTELSSLYVEDYDTIYDMAYGNGQYVAVLCYEEEGYATTTYFYTSTNGVDWNLQTDYPLRGVKLDKIAFGNGKFIAASSENNTYYYSINGVSWVPASFPTNSTCTSLVYSDAYGFMVGREDGSIYCSPTGLPNSWVALEGSVDGAVVDISENGSNLIIASDGEVEKLYYSKDGGKTFTESMNSTYPFYGVASCGKFMVEVGLLPAGYTKLEYIESTGTQYIDTGFKNNQDTRVVMDVQATSIPSTHAWFFGGRTSTSDATMGVFYYASSTKKITADYDGNSQRYKFDSLGATDRLNIDYNKNVLTINSYSKTFTSATFQSTASIALLAANTGGSIAHYVSAKLYSCQIYNNGIPVRDYVPCINPDGAAGLYDLINKQFYANAGSGTFVISSDDPGSTAQYTSFSSLVTPIEWTQVDNNNYTSSNTYGTWKITSKNRNTNTATIDGAFDNETSTKWTASGEYNDSQYSYLIVTCPTGTAIKPTNITVDFKGGNGTIQGLNADTNEWEDLYSIPGTADQNCSISTENYYSQLKFVIYGTSGYTWIHVYEFQITAGMLRISTT